MAASCRVVGVLVFEPFPVSNDLEVISGGVIRDDATLGWNGAALAALGEMVVDFLETDVPLPDKSDGVKLGESTLNRFLLLNYIMSI